MALHTILNLRDSVAGILSGIDLSTVDDVSGCFERAAATLVQKADVPEASGIQNITLYSGVFDYLCDPRIFGTAINDIRPQGVSRNPSNFVTKIDQEDFDRTKSIYYLSGTTSTFQYQNGVPIIRILAPFPTQKVTIDTMSDTTGWTAAGTASNLRQDTTDFYQTPASLRFNLTSGTGTLTKTLQSALSLASYEDVGVAFLAIEIPSGATASNLTGISLKLGSSSGNYDSVSETTGFLGAWTAGQWLLVAFDFSASTSTGTPNWSSIQYVQVSLATTGSFTNFRVGGLFLSLPSQAQILYQSAAIFLASGSTSPTVAITANTDTIILTDAAYNIYLYESALAVLENTGASASDATSIKILQKLNGNGSTDVGLYARFLGDNPSQEIRMSGSYYDTNMPYGQW
jgi:hypothetical protein